MDKSIGIITFHRSYNCGSMLQTYAIQTVIERLGYRPEIVNFSNEGQRQLYQPFQKGLNPKTVIKNGIALLHLSRIKHNGACYERFIEEHFKLSEGDFSSCSQLVDTGYDAVVCGSDQVWNITIDDADDAYFLPWVDHATKVAYATSFGARNIMQYADDPERYATYIKDIQFVSTREKNGKKWIRELTGRDVPVVQDPTLLLDVDDYEKIEDKKISVPDHYIFYYSPTYDRAINSLVSHISKKYGLPVICFNAKSFYVKGMDLLGFSLPEHEDPSVYLRLMRGATLVITTSFHGTIFSTIFERPFWTIKNGGMFGDDDRVLTLMESLGLSDRLVPIAYDEERDYLAVKDYFDCREKRQSLKKDSLAFLAEALRGIQ